MPGVLDPNSSAMIHPCSTNRPVLIPLKRRDGEGGESHILTNHRPGPVQESERLNGACELRIFRTLSRMSEGRWTKILRRPLYRGLSQRDSRTSQRPVPLGATAAWDLQPGVHPAVVEGSKRLPSSTSGRTGSVMVRIPY
jgi:hypothetical protein